MKYLDPTQLNLASQPFRKERAQLTGLVLLAALLTVTLLATIGLIFNGRSEAAGLRMKINADSARLRRVQQDQGRFSAVFLKPENADVFSDSVFLNQLIARRGLSWSRAFRDLEHVFPSDIRLMAIRLPQVGEQNSQGVNRVQLDMVVATMRPESFLTLLKRLEASADFGATSVVNQTPPSQNDPYFKYRLTVAYAQKL